MQNLGKLKKQPPLVWPAYFDIVVFMAKKSYKGTGRQSFLTRDIKFCFSYGESDLR